MGNCQCFATKSELMEYYYQSQAIQLKSFQIEGVLGQGGFGQVLLVTKKDTEMSYAMKVVKKSLIKKKKHLQNINWERKILQKNAQKNKFLVSLRYAFQTIDNIYFVMDLCQGGELFYHLRKQGRFSEIKTQFYSAQIILGLQCLHEQGIIYRDLKPENCLLDNDGNIKLSDFGLSKLLQNEHEKTMTFCGTPDYIAPEIIMGKEYDKKVDFWSLGCLIYEMLAGIPPFYQKNKIQMYSDIISKPVKIRTYFSEEAGDIITKLLVVDVSFNPIAFAKVSRLLINKESQILFIDRLNQIGKFRTRASFQTFNKIKARYKKLRGIKKLTESS